MSEESRKDEDKRLQPPSTYEEEVKQPETPLGYNHEEKSGSQKEDSPHPIGYQHEEHSKIKTNPFGGHQDYKYSVGSREHSEAANPPYDDVFYIDEKEAEKHLHENDPLRRIRTSSEEWKELHESNGDEDSSLENEIKYIDEKEASKYLHENDLERRKKNSPEDLKESHRDEDSSLENEIKYIDEKEAAKHLGKKDLERRKTTSSKEWKELKDNRDEDSSLENEIKYIDEKEAAKYLVNNNPERSRTTSSGAWKNLLYSTENESIEDLRSKDKKKSQNDMFDYDLEEPEKEREHLYSDENKSIKGK